jgi:hypothetical protein
VINWRCVLNVVHYVIDIDCGWCTGLMGKEADVGYYETQSRQALEGTELNAIWVQALPGPRHLGFKTGPLCPMFYTKLEEPCSFSKVPDVSYTWLPNILQVQKEGTQICMSDWGQGLTLNAKCGLRFPPQYCISYRCDYYSAPLYIYICLLKVLCPVSRPITTLDCVLIKDNNRTLVARSGPEINSLAFIGGTSEGTKGLSR